jgi:hypothetical protein
MLAAQEQILEAARVGWGPDVTTGLDEVVKEHQARIGRARRWLRAAVAESRLRGESEPLEIRYYLAHVETARGRADIAAGDLAIAMQGGDVERWRGERMGAMLRLLQGDVEDSMRLAHRATIDAPPGHDRMVSEYVLALVLDRVGDPAAAREGLQTLRGVAGHTAARRVAESLLPIHERLYLRAIDHQANRERSNAVRLWAAYLARPEPEPPDKELARRHRAELQVRPPPVEP